MGHLYLRWDIIPLNSSLRPPINVARLVAYPWSMGFLNSGGGQLSHICIP